MARYKIEIKRSATKEIEHLERSVILTIMQKIHSLVDNPRPHGCEKLSGQDRYRVRCGNYRILYTIEDWLLVICVVKVGHRRDVYRC